MIGVATNFYGLTIQIVANTTHITMQLFLIRRKYHWCSILGTKHNVDVIFTNDCDMLIKFIDATI